MTEHNNNNARAKLYQAWSRMKSLCHSHSYKLRSITYPSSWKTFQGFSNEMASSYKAGLSLLRKDVDSPYSTDNCFWGVNSQKSRSDKGKGVCGHKGVYRVTDGNGNEIYRALWRDPETETTKFKGFSSSKHGSNALSKAIEYSRKVRNEPIASVST